MLSWRLALKANALYRDGSKLSQPLNSSVLAAATKTTTTITSKSWSPMNAAARVPAVAERIVEKIIEREVEVRSREKMPASPQGLYPEGRCRRPQGLCPHRRI
jgi:ribonucleoside-diphosphate reductase alpha chain